MLKRSRYSSQWVGPSSLQTRLALGVALLATLSIGTMAAWMSWKTEQILVGRHVQQVTNVVAQIPQDIERYRGTLPLDEAVQKVIDLRSFSNMFVVAMFGGEFTTRSAGARQDYQIVNRLMAQMDRAEDPRPKSSAAIDTRITTVNGRDYLVCSGPLPIDQAESPTLYVFLDITEDRAQLADLTQSLGAAAAFTLLILVVTVALYVKRSLRPLRRMSQITAHLKLEELGHVRVSLENAPAEVSELVETCETMLARLAKALDQQRQFTHDISHELRTPLTISYGYLQSLQRRGDNLKPPQRDALKTAIAETEHSIAILEDLLSLARGDSGTLQFSPSDVDVSALLQTVAKQVESCSQRTIIVDSPPLGYPCATHQDDSDCSSTQQQETENYLASSATLIKADPDRLRQVLLKLLDNALRYSRPDQPVTLKLKRRDDSAIIQVCDRGIGIPLPDQQRIFDPCYRVDAARNRATGGSGLGLSLVRTLVEGMGGRIGVTSEPDKGSTFTISLPLSLDADETSHRSGRRRRKTGSLY